jgi:hypothetical protein
MFVPPVYVRCNRRGRSKGRSWLRPGAARAPPASHPSSTSQVREPSVYLCRADDCSLLRASARLAWNSETQASNYHAPQKAPS